MPTQYENPDYRDLDFVREAVMDCLTDAYCILDAAASCQGDHERILKAIAMEIDDHNLVVENSLNAIK